MRAIVLFAVVIACPVTAEADPVVFRAGLGASYLDARLSHFQRIKGYGPGFELGVGFRRASGWILFADLTVDAVIPTEVVIPPEVFDHDERASMQLVGLGAGARWSSPGGWSVAVTLRLAVLAMQFDSPPSGSRNAFGFDLRFGRRLLATRAWQLDVQLRPGLAWLTPQSEGSGGYQALPSICLGVAVTW